MRTLALAVATMLAAAPLRAACPDDAAVAAMAADILAGIPTDPVAVETIEDGLCAQGKLVAILSQTWGAPVGWKAGLTSAPAQKAFGVGEPVRGVLFAGMMVAPGAAVPAVWGAVPRYEADMVAVIGSEAVNAAKSPAEVMAALSAIHPFIELPDLVVKNPRGLTGPGITAINVGARKGVLGAAIPASAELVAALASMTVRVTDQTGKVLAEAPGAAILGHPLNAVLWLRDAGVRFRAGDLVSMGSFGPLLVPEAGLTATVTYAGLPGDPSVSVRFE